MPNKTFQEMMSDAHHALLTGREFVRINRDSSPTASATICILNDAIQDLLGTQLPEMQQLEPIDFGPNDEDRVKDMFEKVYLMEYERSRSEVSALVSNGLAHTAADEAAKNMRTWLKKQEAE